MVCDFFVHERLPLVLNKANIVLLPKKDNSSTLNNYKSISLCNLVYKVITKILASRVIHFLPNVISPLQTDFVEGRVIAENSIITSEVLHTMKKKRGKRGLMFLKIDMKKAYDRVDWGFLENVLTNFGFKTKWIRWVMLCVRSASFSVLLNGRVVGNVTPTRGLR